VKTLSTVFLKQQTMMEETKSVFDFKKKTTLEQVDVYNSKALQLGKICKIFFMCLLRIMYLM